MKLSGDWHDFKAKLDKNYPRVGKPTQLSFEYAGEEEDDGKGPVTTRPPTRAARHPWAARREG